MREQREGEKKRDRDRYSVQRDFHIEREGDRHTYIEIVRGEREWTSIKSERDSEIDRHTDKTRQTDRDR